MLDIDITDTNVAVLKPQGALSSADFEQLTAAFEGYVNREDRVPNLLIDADKIPHWDSFSAMIDHLRFIRGHHRLIHKVAIVGDGLALAAMPMVADRFVDAKVRRFPHARIDDAMHWAEIDEDHPGRFELIDGLPSDVLALEAIGIITAQDYSGMLIPLVEDKLKVHDRLKVLVLLGDHFIGYSEDAAWDDARFGVSHWFDFGKMALVTDLGWARHVAKLFAPLMPGGLRVFPVADLDAAKSWIKT